VQVTNRKKKSVSRREWKWFKRRSAIEPIFGHLKSDNKLERNHLRGKEDDRINAILAGCGFNKKKAPASFLFAYNLLAQFGSEYRNEEPRFHKTSYSCFVNRLFQGRLFILSPMGEAKSRAEVCCFLSIHLSILAFFSPKKQLTLLSRHGSSLIHSDILIHSTLNLPSAAQ
jgi:hypothetical protein